MRRPRGIHGIQHTNQSLRFCRCSGCVESWREWQRKYGRALWNPRDAEVLREVEFWMECRLDSTDSKRSLDGEDGESVDEEEDVVARWLQKRSLEEIATRYANGHGRPCGPNSSQGRCVNAAPFSMRKKALRGAGARGGRKGGRKSGSGHRQRLIKHELEYEARCEASRLEEERQFRREQEKQAKRREILLRAEEMERRRLKEKQAKRREILLRAEEMERERETLLEWIEMCRESLQVDLKSLQEETRESRARAALRRATRQEHATAREERRLRKHRRDSKSTRTSAHHQRYQAKCRRLEVQSWEYDDAMECIHGFCG